jgi:hypothetical protein
LPECGVGITRGIERVADEEEPEHREGSERDALDDDDHHRATGDRVLDQLTESVA